MKARKMAGAVKKTAAGKRVKWIRLRKRQPAKRKVFGLKKWPKPKQGRPSLKSPFSASIRGVNLIGFIRAETGIGESARLGARALVNTDIPFGIMNYKAKHDVRTEDTTWSYKEMDKAVYNTNIFHINGDMIKRAARHFGDRVTRNKYNIGYWHWELPEYPRVYCKGFDVVQEVWVPSTFVLDSVSMKSKVPVVRIPHGIEVGYQAELNRDYFGLPHGRFLFCSMYDTQSYHKRKNPLAAIEAFKRAFDHEAGVALVIKVNNPESKPGELDLLRQAAAGHHNIILLDRTMTRLEVNSLLQCVDCFVSLHRSEGFGLGLAEAMYLGKPVIGTNWSGNTDFMHPGNSCAVNYKLVDVGEYWGPYEAHQKWAEPDIDHAVEYMRRLVTHPEWRQMIAENGQHTIRSQYSPQVVGQMVKKRLIHLGLIQ
ncbi:glycosyltransferase family 4 protein [Paenibacillus sp. OAS669]|uniref:glycosyltransferase family 4 protein n=1 Tax=Paenibacillus sp. OAS669 TaxID=2663821 RepID=UPI0019F7FD4A|nr:glycosyltransferase family 4 protein [Paenibacillus sp. OAS669]MBE1447145.1 glycosyltransferase involved in cell wall biosynthesis [Paenibacillus sp. OAS669]